jgi:hypothetical protein
MRFNLEHNFSIARKSYTMEEELIKEFSTIDSDTSIQAMQDHFDEKVKFPAYASTTKKIALHEDWAKKLVNIHMRTYI